MDFWLIIIAFGVVQGIFLVIALSFDKRLQALQKYLLLALLGSMALLSAEYVVTNYWLLNELGVCPIIGLAGWIWPGLVPLFYLTVRSFLPEAKLPLKQVILHLSPLLFSLFVNVPFLLASAADRQAYLLGYSYSGEAAMLHWILKSTYHLQLLIYPVLLLRLLKKQSVPKRSAANFLTIGLLLLGVASFVHLLTFNFLLLPFSWLTSNSVFISLTFFIQALAMLAVSRPEWLFLPVQEVVVKYSNSNLSKLDLPQLAQCLKVLMEEEKIYHDADLNLATLAQRLSVSPHQLSEFLNRENGKTFGEFVNRYRVEEAQQLLRQDATRHLTVLAVAYEVGFSSNATFYRYFKNMWGSRRRGG